MAIRAVASATGKVRTPHRITGTGSGGGGFVTTPTSLLHFDGSQGSSTFTDESGKAWARLSGTASLTTTNPKFGTASLTEALTSISTPNHADWDFGSGDFVFDFWARFGADQGGNEYLIYKGDFGSFAPVGILMLTTNKLNFVASNNGSSFGVNLTMSGTIVRDNSTYHHIEFGRFGNTFYAWYDGAAVGNAVMTGPLTTNSGAWVIGGTSNIGEGLVNRFNGGVDEFRAVKGGQVHTAPFTPPTSPYTYP